MNVGEFGIPFYFSTGFNMLAATFLTLTFTKPDGTQLVVTSPAVSVGTSSVPSLLSSPCLPPSDPCAGQAPSCECGTPAVAADPTPVTFAPYLYVRYIFAAGDVNQSGCWSARLTYQDATPRQLISDPATFSVSP